jgi:quinol monooxygenase YgiN
MNRGIRARLLCIYQEDTMSSHSSAMPSAQTMPTAHTAGGAHVTWLFELAVRDGRAADLQVLMAEMVAATQRDEPGALDYEWYLTDDGKRLHLLERYADAAAATTHLANFGARYMGRFFDVLAPERISLYGAADDAVRDALSQLRPEILRRADGFSR